MNFLSRLKCPINNHLPFKNLLFCTNSHRLSSVKYILKTNNICNTRFIHRTVVLYNGKLTQRPKKRDQYESTADKKVPRVDNLNQYAGLNVKRKIEVYGWGMAKTGALGVKSLFNVGKNGEGRHVQLTPLRMCGGGDGFKVQRVACGYGTTCVVGVREADRKQVLMVSGINTDCQLGLQDLKSQHKGLLTESTQLDILQKDETIIDVSCGRAHTIIATNHNNIYSLGNNTFGQCGRKIINDEVYSENPVIRVVKMECSIKQVECGQDHSLVLLEDGRVISCGLGSDGQTGQGIYECVDEWTEVGGDLKGEKIVQISSKADTVLAVSENGDVFGWGSNEYDQLWSVSQEDQQIHTARHMRIEGGMGRVRVVAAAGSMCALVDDKDDVYTWGYGILGRGPRVDRCQHPHPIPSILFGYNHYSLHNNAGGGRGGGGEGRFKLMKKEKFNINNNNSNNNKNNIINANNYNNTNNLTYNNYNNVNNNDININYNKSYYIKDIQCGLYNFAVLTVNGDMYVWGRNNSSCLGLAHDLKQFFPYKVHLPSEVTEMSCGVDHSVVVCRSYL